MCPLHRRRHDCNNMSRRTSPHSQEAESPQGEPATSGQRARLQIDFSESDTDDETYDGSDTSDDDSDVLISSSVEQYAAVQQPTAVRQLTCEISEVLTVQTQHCNISSTSYIESVMYENRPFMEVDRASSDDDDGESGITVQSEDISEDTDIDILEFSPMHNRRAYTHNTCRRKNRPAPNQTIARRRLRLGYKMPAATATATQVANQVIKYARCIHNKFETEMCCLTCGLFPSWPVTGSCGHTRCLKCTELMKTCPCGEASPESLHINVLIRDCMQKVQETKSSSMEESRHIFFTPYIPQPMSMDDSCNSICGVSTPSSSLLIQNFHSRRTPTATHSRHRRRLPMSYLARYNQAVELLMTGKYSAAAPHLALAAASHEPNMRRARALLAQCITIMSRTRDPRSLSRQLNHLIRDLSSTSWVRPSDMECILCCDTFTSPVTTPCGHMFCRTCIERTMDYKKRCPLCLRSLNFFNLTETGDTILVQASLKSVNLVNEPAPLEPDLIPIFVCTVAYPSVPCPLFIFDPRYWLMIRRVLESGSRKFGMVACDRGKSYVDYGTILEVRDCVHLEDGRSILSTIGLSRFKVIERDVRDGCEVARILPIIDIPVLRVSLRGIAEKVMLKAFVWIGSLNAQVKEDIEAAFGSLPEINDSDENSADGPSWLWWLVAVLPLRTEIKVLILSTTCLLKRLLAVSRTLEAVDQVALTTASPSECELRHNHERRTDVIPMQVNDVNEQDVS